MKSRIVIQNSNGVAVTAFVVCIVAGVAGTMLTQHAVFAVAGLLVGLYLLNAIKVVKQ